MGGAPTIGSIFAQRVVIGVGDVAVSNNPQVTLSTYALGSCVGIVAYDPFAKAGGILHLMLPDSTISPEKALNQPAMFANTGLPLFFRLLHGVKVERGRLRLFVAGGASVLAGKDNFKIGERNVRATLEFLSKQGFSFGDPAVGGTINRTIHLEVGTGRMTLKTPTANDTLSLAA
jgi:chemotaxis protein CheD